MTEVIMKPETEQEAEKNTTAEVVKTDKTYSEEQVQKLVQDRLTREKAVSKRQAEEFTVKESEYKAQLESYEKVMKGFIEEKVKEQSEPVKKLLAKLSLIEQWEFLSDPQNKIDKKQLPSTPKSSGEEESKPRKKIGVII
jgi:hypothetical protein